jgi:hypothetical protein
LSGRINLLESPGLVEVLAQVSKEPHNIAIGAGIALLFDFTIRLLSYEGFPLVILENLSGIERKSLIIAC